MKTLAATVLLLAHAATAHADTQNAESDGTLNPEEMTLRSFVERARGGEADPVICMQGYMAVKSGRHDWGNDIFEACAEQGYTSVYHWRSYMAHNGLGRPESPEEAAEWDKKAADAGDPIGQFNYGLDLLRGHGVASSQQHRDKRPELFHSESGLRIGRYRAPIPDDVPGAERINAPEAKALLAKGALAIDVFGAPQSRFDELDGTWMVSKKRESLPGAVWLPEVGRGSTNEVIQAYFSQHLARLTRGDETCPIILFCIADCWMSWNAVQRATALGYSNVYWLAEGTDGWLDEGWSLAPVDPIPVDVD